MNFLRKNLAAVLFATGFLLTAEKQKKLSLSLEPYAGFTSGILEETIYRSLPKEKKISLLEWERKIFVYGASLDFKCSSLNLNLNLETAPQNSKSGQMRDSDWLNPDDYSMKTTYSAGTNYAMDYRSAEVSLFYDFFSGTGFTLSPVVTARYDYDSFYRKKGAEGWYSQDCRHWWHDSSSKHYPWYNPETGKTQMLAEIDYLRHSFYSWAGLKLTFTPSENLEFLFCAMISPVTYLYSVDTHFAQDSSTKLMYKKHYRQRQLSYFSNARLEVEAQLRLCKSFFLTAGFETAFNFKTDRGDLYSDYFQDVYQGEYIDCGQDSSSSLKNIKAKIGLKIRLL